jgi:hypothetical protein
MPAAHALLQVRQDLPELISGLSVEKLWLRVGDSAPIGFHAMHIAGATERLLAYARAEALSDAQLAQARAEKALTGLDSGEIITRVRHVIDAAIGQIRITPEDTLTNAREVGRQKLSSNVIGLIFHAAEHATRHAGQIATLRRIVAAS